MKQFYHRLWCLLVIILGFPWVVNAQLETLGLHFKSKNQKSVTLEFQLYNNLIIIPIQINDSEKLNFVLDTGVGYTLITEPSLLTQMKMNCLRKVKVSGSGTGSELQGCIVQAQNINIKGGIVSKNHNLIILEEDILHLSSYAGIKIHGLIGYDLFSRFVVKIDYMNQSLTLIRPDVYIHKPKKKEEVFAMSIEQMKPYVQAEAIIRNQVNKLTSLKLILDTGAGHSLSLEAGTHPDIVVPEKNVPSYLGMTLNGSVEGAIGRIEKFKLGSFELPKVITSFPDSSSMRFLRNLGERHGNVGCGVLRRFHLTFDYPHNRLILRPNRSFKEPFEFNTSGLELSASGEDFKTYSIGSIRKGSPAEEAGLQRGDTIIAIDDSFANDLKMSEIYKILNKKEGKRTALFVKRKDMFFVVEIKLRQPI
jgi:hypothetical protein